MAVTWDASSTTIATDATLGLCFNNTQLGTRDDAGTLHAVWVQGNQTRHGRLSAITTVWTVSALPRFSVTGSITKPTLSRAGSHLFAAWSEGASVVLCRSTDLGVTWSPPIQVTTGNSSVLSLTALTRPNGTPAVVLVWVTQSTEKVQACAWRGTTWAASDFTTPVALATTASPTRDPCVTSDGSTVYTIWEDTRSGNDQLYLTQSTDFGVTWTAEQAVRSSPGGTILSGGDPSLVALPGGTFYLGYQRINTVYLRTSTSLTAGFSDLGAQGSGLFAHTAASASGVIAMAWEQFTGSLFDDSKKTVGLSLSLDRGAGFDRPSAMPGSATATARTQAGLVLGSNTLDVFWLERSGTTPALQHRTARFGIVPSNPQPVTVTSSPAPVTVYPGSPANFSVVVSGTAPFTYQWRRNGIPLEGATSSNLILSAPSEQDGGSYDVVVSNAAGSVISAAATLTVLPSDSRITNLSVRTSLAASQRLVVGFVTQGGVKPVVMRAVGPGLAAFGVTGSMADPQLELYQDAVRIDQNDQWGGTTALITAFARVGAFALDAFSLDAALQGSVSGGRTVQVYSAGSGIVLVEVYDAEASAPSRLVNVSARNRVGTGDDRLIAGFTLVGNGTRRILVRAVGPTLAGFGVSGALSDPRLEVYSGPVKVADNDTYSAATASHFASVGAFALNPGSTDAALLLTLAPGGYTVQVAGSNGGTGEALVEVYELP